jgi:hypothetical protein
LATVTKRVRPAAPGVGEAVADAVGEITAVAVAAGTGVATGLAALTTRATAIGKAFWGEEGIEPVPSSPSHGYPQQYAADVVVRPQVWYADVPEESWPHNRDPATATGVFREYTHVFRT